VSDVGWVAVKDVFELLSFFFTFCEHLLEALRLDNLNGATAFRAGVWESRGVHTLRREAIFHQVKRSSVARPPTNYHFNWGNARLRPPCCLSRGHTSLAKSSQRRPSITHSVCVTMSSI